MTQALPIRFQEHLQVKEKLKVHHHQKRKRKNSLIHIGATERTDAPFDCESRAGAMEFLAISQALRRVQQLGASWLGEIAQFSPYVCVRACDDNSAALASSFSPD